MEDFIYWSMVHKIWGVKCNSLLKYLIQNISGEEFWHLSLQEIKTRFPTISQEMACDFILKREKLSYKIEKEKILKANIKIISILHKEYPERLRKIPYPPALLYIRGSIPEKNLAIAIVGARKATPYGKKIAQNLGYQLSQEDVQVISGLARGIDAFGHLGAVEGKGGTIAVLGSGVNVVYPRENISIYKKIVDCGNGCILSEFPLDTQPLKINFPIRNRIISGLSDGVVIVEAGEKSGSLITAEFALEQGKEVFAVPGPISSPMSKGPHKLLKEGAKLVADINDIFEEFGQLKFFEFEDKKVHNLNQKEEAILKILGVEPIFIDDIVKETQMPFGEVIATLSLLEIKGLVVQVPGRKFMTVN